MNSISFLILSIIVLLNIFSDSKRSVIGFFFVNYKLQYNNPNNVVHEPCP